MKIENIQILYLGRVNAPFITTSNSLDKDLSSFMHYGPAVTVIHRHTWEDMLTTAEHLLINKEVEVEAGGGTRNYYSCLGLIKFSEYIKAFK